MDGLDFLIKLAGQWRGVNKLWLPPAETPYESTSIATLTPVVKGKFVRLDYTWVFEDEPQEGCLLVGYEVAAGVNTVWVDSWHMGDKVMLCQGQLKAEGGLDVRGFYTVPGYPDWGWRIVIEPGEDETWRMVMYNVSPEGEEFLAVEVSYTRVP